MRDTFLPFSVASLGEEEIAEVVDTLRSGWLTTGPKTGRFERQFGTHVGASNAIAVNSCTAGLHIALRALGVGRGDEVIVPTLTFCSSANVVVHLGAKPVLVDVEDDFNAAPAAIAAAITPRTKAVLPVHFAGQACDLDALYALALRHGLAVVEDAAHAVGGTYRGRMIGADGLAPVGVMRATVFSFYPTKCMTTGEGGMITTADGELAERMRRLALHGINRDAWTRYTSEGSWYYEVTAPGYKYNMTDVQASLGIHQLGRLHEFIAARRRLAGLYDQAFAGIPEVATPRVHQDRGHAYHLYVIRLAVDRLSGSRAGFIEELKRLNIGSSVHFIPVHRHPFYRDTYGYRPGEFPMADALYDRIVSLPLYPKMTDADAGDVVAAVAAILDRNRLS